MQARYCRNKISILFCISLLLGMINVVSTPSIALAVTQGSLYFPGNAAVGHINYSLTAPYDGQFTYEGWFKIDATATGEFFVFTTRESEFDARGFSLRAYKQANGKWSFYSASSKVFLATNPTGYLDKDTWYHFAVTREADGYFRYYANGVLYGTSTFNTISTSLQMQNIMYGLWLKGWMSNFRITIGSALYTSAGTKPQQNDAALTLGANQTLFMANYSNLKAVQKISTTIIDLINLTADPWGNNSITQSVTSSVDNPFPKVTPTFSWANQTKTMGDAPYALTTPTPSTPGTFTYSSATPGVISIDNANAENATVVASGSSLITATFSPIDTDTYSSATTTMTITVNKMLQSDVSITLSPTTKVIKSGFSQVLTSLSGSGGAGTGAFSYSVSTVTAGANCALANNAGTYTLTADMAGACTLTATRASDASYQSASASTNFIFSTPVRTLSFATTAYTLAYLATQQVTASASANGGPTVITYSAGVSTACSVGANTGIVSITASTGTCSISASVAEDVTYLATSTVTPVAITVGKAAQTPIVLTVSPTSKNGIAPFIQQLVTISTTGGTGTGVLAYSTTDVTAGATCQLTENAGVYTVTAATAGTCSITATKPADTNYLVSADSKTFSFNPSRTLSFAAGLGGGVKSGVTAPTAGPFLTGDTFVIPAGSAYERAGFSFNSWSDGTNTFAAGDNYTVASANITLTAQWRQTSLFGILDADLEEMQSWNASNRTNSGTISNTAGTSSVTVTVPANSLTSGTTVKLWELKNSDFAKSKVDPSKDYIVNLVLSWLKDNGVGQAQTVPTASTPITLSISNNTIKKGAIAYQIIGDVVTQIGTATADGVLNLSITEDPVISIANPIVQAPNNGGGGGGGGGGGAPVVIVEKTPEVVKPIEVEKPAEVVPVLAKTVQVTHKVFFGMNAAWINSANIKSLKSFIAKISASNQLSQITVEGFTQPTPINPNPLVLSKARANSVAKLIRLQGVKAKIVKAGKGDEKVNDPSSRYVLVTVTTTVAG